MIYIYLIVVSYWWLLHCFISKPPTSLKDDVRYFENSEMNFAQFKANENQRVLKTSVAQR